jgi:hypothetical protein
MITIERSLMSREHHDSSPAVPAGQAKEDGRKTPDYEHSQKTMMSRNFSLQDAMFIRKDSVY